jgi:hypothetical protein
MYRALTLLLFFPSITFGLISAEVFPWGAIFAAFYMRYCSQPMLLVVGLLYLSAFFALFMSFLSGGVLETDVIRSIAAYLNVLLVSQTLLLLGKERAVELCMLSRKIFWGLIALGLVQTLGSDLLGNVIQLLVPRGEGSALVESNRGVTLLATEPARAGIELTLIYLIYRLTRVNSRKDILVDLFVIVFQALIIKSASSVAFSAGAFAIMYFRVRANILTSLGTILFASLLIFFVTTILPTMGGRTGDLVLYLSDSEISGEALFYLANESGNRLLALYSFFLSGFNHPLGFGVGSWPYSSMIAVQESGLDYREFRFFDVRGNGNLIPFRGPGVVSNLLLDVGVLGVILLFVLFKQVMLKYGEFNHLSRKAFWIFFLKISLFGSPGNPIVFIFFITVFLASSSWNASTTKKCKIGLY